MEVYRVEKDSPALHMIEGLIFKIYKELKHRLQQTKEFNYKIWYISKQRILNREIFNGREALKEI